MDSETWEHQICNFYVTYLDGDGSGHDYEDDDDGVDENEAELDVCSFLAPSGALIAIPTY